MIKMQEYSKGGGCGITDLARVQSIMHSIEIACSSVQMHINPAAAEATILALCQSPQPYKACQFILDNSQVANARFQAAAASAIQDAAMREWAFLMDDNKKSLISFCLRFVMEHAGSPEGFSEIVYVCLRDLRALASYHYKETDAGVRDSNGNPQEGILSRFHRSLLQLLLFEAYSPDMVGTQQMRYFH